MANIVETNTWEEYIRRIETGEPVAGGASAPVNLALQDLANRTLYLKTELLSLLNALNAISALVGETSMGDVLLKANNLSDLADKATARSNLGVSAADHTHGAYMSKAANLSDIENPLIGRQNLGVLDILFGPGVPVVGTGKNGDLYIRTDLDHVSIYKKSAGAWTVAITNVNIPGNAATATLAALATLAETCSGNSATADRLKTARLINGVSFSGAENITVPPHSAAILNTSGYIKFHGSGLMIQWGLCKGDVIFPVAFPNACLTAQFTVTSGMYGDESVSDYAYSVRNLSKNGLTGGHSSWFQGRYLAIGY